jgi:hypothetical protein
VTSNWHELRAREGRENRDLKARQAAERQAFDRTVAECDRLNRQAADLVSRTLGRP